MTTLIASVIVFGFLIIVHEIGHLCVAKLCGIRVERFSIGFGPKIFGRTFGGTEYIVSAFPLGGYVKMPGEHPEEEAEDAPKTGDTFTEKPPWKRMLVVVAGPLFNLLAAAAILVVVFMTGVPVLQPVVGGVQAGYPAAEAGLLAGDRIVEVGGRAITEWESMTEIIHGSAGRKLAVVIERGGERLTMDLTPRSSTVKNLFGEESSVGLIGISPSGATISRRFPVGSAIVMGVRRTGEIIVLTIVGIVKIFQRVIPADEIGGPLMIIQMAGEQAKGGVMNLAILVAFLSVNLGVINLFPIPILDGGLLLFLLIETVRRKPLSLRQREVIQQIGLVLLISLFLFASYNDIFRLVSRYYLKQ
jgi:regulator of sigma E protease